MTDLAVGAAGTYKKSVLRRNALGLLQTLFSRYRHLSAVDLGAWIIVGREGFLLLVRPNFWISRVPRLFAMVLLDQR
jgi:hypothetical protein